MRQLGEAQAAKLRRLYRAYSVPDLGYATVRDFCDSADHLRPVCGLDGDLKNVQRPWMLKAILGRLPPPARLLEVGGGEPLVAGALVELGYEVTIVDPYDGSGNGPTQYEQYVRAFPEVRILRAVFAPDVPELRGRAFDGIYSVSVLEHIRHHDLPLLFEAAAQCLRLGGQSIHCVDHVLEGWGADYHEEGLAAVLLGQERLRHPEVALSLVRDRSGAALREVLARLRADLEAFYLSPQGHNLWRGGKPYEEFPFRKVASIQTCATKG